jgi:hypothetical protein
MPPSWRAGLVSAFPVPDDRRKKRKNRTIPSSEALMPAAPETPSSADDPPVQSFAFLSLPPEIRTKIYNLILFPPPRLPLDPKPSPSHTSSSLSLLRTSRLVHSETTHLLYTHTAFPLFPIQAFPPLPTPLLIPPRHRYIPKSLHLRLGNSWSAPPKSWRVSKLLARALPKFGALKTLKVFVEVDPSEPMFEKYRISRDFYTDFAGELLQDVIKAIPQLKTVEIGGYEFVNLRGPLVTRIRRVVEEMERKLLWSVEDGWREKAKTLDGSVAEDRGKEDESLDLNKFML